MPPPRTSLRSIAALRSNQSRRILNNAAPCLLCSTARHRPATTAPILLHRAAPRSYATIATSPPTSTQPTPPPSAAADARAELEQALLDLNKHAANHVNLSRLQLALLGLRQPPGEESIRVAVVAVDDGGRGGSGDTAREVLRLLLADPLTGEEKWEGRLKGAARGAPVLVKVAGQGREEAPGPRGVIERKSMFEELHVSAPGFGGGSLEVLLMDAIPPAGPGAEEALLDLPVDIPSGGGRYTPIMTPVHKTVLVADGFAGIPLVSRLAPNDEHGVIFSAVNLPGYHPEAAEPLPAAPFLPVDVPLAAKGVGVFRESLANGMEYERLWSQSRFPALLSWVKSGTAPQPGATKPAIRALISSVLQNTLANLEASQAGTSTAVAAKQPATADSSPRPAARLPHRGLEDWAQSAHAELQDRLDLAFTGRRWRQLNWWKLFWRVDDVGALTSDIVSRDFLPAAERNLVYLAGQVSASSSSGAAAEGGASTVVTYPQPAAGPAGGEQRWPTHISFTRRYLQEETVPALQALAQRLVVKAVGTSGLTTSLAALLYASQWASNLYEAGAVAALGTVWSLWRLQGGWEAARAFWEGEVREEGRKAVRGAERSMTEAMEGGSGLREEHAEEERRVREIVGRARDALERLK